MFNITVKTVPDDQQRYNTVGDYYIDKDGNRVFVVSDMKDWRYEFLVVLHEFVESALCKNRNISDTEIDTFDFEYEKNRDKNDGISEAGNSPDAPYFKEHQVATKIEKMLAEELNVDWDEYMKITEKLMLNKEVL